MFFRPACAPAILSLTWIVNLNASYKFIAKLFSDFSVLVTVYNRFLTNVIFSIKVNGVKKSQFLYLIEKLINYLYYHSLLLLPLAPQPMLCQQWQ
jgi:hypothetical protein